MLSHLWEMCVFPHPWITDTSLIYRVLVRVTHAGQKAIPNLLILMFLVLDCILAASSLRLF
jgi:hypothetical protein